MNYGKIFLFILLVGIISCGPKNYNYRVKDYKLTLEPRENSADANVFLEITYLIDDSESKSDGFKFVGTGIVDSLICSDETGIIQGKVEYLRETKISWFFNSVKSGTKKINAKFILSNCIKRIDNIESEISVPWAGVFRVPVDQAKYVLVMHKANAKLKFEKPENWKHENIDGLDYYSVSQAPLEDKVIKVQLVNNK